MTPADQMSDAGSTADLRTSGGMNLHQGSRICHSTPKLERMEEAALQAAFVWAAALWQTAEPPVPRMPQTALPVTPHMHVRQVLPGKSDRVLQRGSPGRPLKSQVRPGKAVRIIGHRQPKVNGLQR